MTTVFIKAQHVTQAILLDQFGVLHDGRKPYPGAIEAVTALADSGRSVLIISNSSRRMHPHNGSCGLSVGDLLVSSHTEPCLEEVCC